MNSAKCGANLLVEHWTHWTPITKVTMPSLWDFADPQGEFNKFQSLVGSVSVHVQDKTFTVLLLPSIIFLESATRVLSRSRERTLGTRLIAVPFHICLFDFTFACSISHLLVLFHICLFHFIFACSISHLLVPFHFCLFYFTFACSISHLLVPFHICLFHFTFVFLVVSATLVDVTLDQFLPS